MATVEGLNQRGSRWSLLVLIPKDLRASYEGKAKINLALGTSDKAEAVRKGLRLRAQWLEEFEAKRKALNPQKLESITPEMVQALAQGAHRRILQGDQERREGKCDWLALLSLVGVPIIKYPGWFENLRKNRDPLEGLTIHERATLARINTAEDQEAAENLARLNLLHVLPALQQDAQAMGFTVDRNTPGIKEALTAYLQAYRKAWQEATQRDAGELISIDSHLPITSAPKAATSLSKGLPAAGAAGLATLTGAPEGQSLRDIHALWLKANPKTHDTEQASQRAMSLAEECLGAPLYVQQVTRAHGNTFKAWLQEPARGFGPKTAKNQLMYVNSLLRFACEELEVIQKNPWKGLAAIVVPKTVTRRPWKDEELHQLFKQPLFQAYEVPAKGRSGGGPAAYWIPIIGIYTGARIGELAQLRVSDITEEDGIPVIRITDEGEGQSVKTSASRRYIPLHSELIRLGLLEYAEGIRKAGHESLWPHLQNPNLMSAWFGRYRKSVGLDGEWLDFHSFRHTVRTRLAKAQVPEQLMDAITGHETGGSTGRKVYTHLDMHDRKEAIERLSYGTQLELPRVCPVG